MAFSMRFAEEGVSFIGALYAQRRRRGVAVGAFPHGSIVSGEQPDGIPPTRSMAMGDDLEPKSRRRPVVVFVAEYASHRWQGHGETGIHAPLIRFQPEEPVTHCYDVPHIAHFKSAEMATALQPNIAQNFIKSSERGVHLDVDIEPERATRSVYSEL